MSILVVGAEGAQGKRYRAILKYLGMPYLCRDVVYPAKIDRQVDAVVIATPTNTHVEVIREYLKLGIPILCEKPIDKDPALVAKILEEAEAANVKLSMVMQYRQLIRRDLKSRSRTFYNYFRHGNDGLVWDCLQVIGLANSEITLGESSPVWQCAINGHELNIRDMDHAYVREVWDWINKVSHESHGEILQIHQKVEAFAKRQ